jgi:hypothetical protein
MPRATAGCIVLTKPVLRGKCHRRTERNYQSENLIQIDITTHPASDHLKKCYALLVIDLRMLTCALCARGSSFV